MIDIKCAVLHHSYYYVSLVLRITGMQYVVRIYQNYRYAHNRSINQIFLKKNIVSFKYVDVDPSVMYF